MIREVTIGRIIHNRREIPRIICNRRTIKRVVLNGKTIWATSEYYLSLEKELVTLNKANNWYDTNNVYSNTNWNVS